LIEQDNPRLDDFYYSYKATKFKSRKAQ